MILIWFLANFFKSSYRQYLKKSGTIHLKLSEFFQWSKHHDYDLLLTTNCTREVMRLLLLILQLTFLLNWKARDVSVFRSDRLQKIIKISVWCTCPRELIWRTRALTRMSYRMGAIQGVFSFLVITIIFWLRINSMAKEGNKRRYQLSAALEAPKI